MFTFWILWASLFHDAPSQWPGFLGAGASSIVAESIPLEWSPQKNMAWTREIPGYGQSSPVIWGDRIFLTSVDGPNKEMLHVVCYSLQSGDQLWDVETPSTNPEKSSVYISRAAPTPVVDAERVYAYFEGGDVLAVSHTGEKVWARSLSNDYGKPKNEFGLSASLVQTTDRLFVLIDDIGPSYLVAINKATGEVVWKSDRTSRKSWSSPSIVQTGDQFQIVCSSSGSVDGYDPLTGQLLWSNTDVGGNSGTTPLPVGNGRFLVAASPGRDGERTEKAKESNGLMRLNRSGDQWVPEFAWKTDTATPSWASPVAYRGYAYWINRTGVVYCFELETGKSVYTERILQSVWATPVGIGDRLYCFGKDGLTTVLATGPEFKVLASNELWSAEKPPVNRTPGPDESSPERSRASGMFGKPTLYGTAIVNGSLVLRTGSQLFCIRTGESAE